MSFKVNDTSDGRAVLQFADEPAYCHALESAPRAREAMLDKGRWLVVAFARWSKPDIGAIQTALDAVRRFRGAVQLGARPYDDVEEHRAWLPEFTGSPESPLWVLLENGAVTFQATGQWPREALIEAIKLHLVEPV